MTSRSPIAVLIEKQRARLAKIEERLGYLMTQRADEEQILADLIEHRNTLTRRETCTVCDGPIDEDCQCRCG